jgi:hypothetical protein
MATVIKSKVFDFVAYDYATTSPEVKILLPSDDISKVQAQPEDEKNFVQRWHLSIQGEANPIVSRTAASQKGKSGEAIYRYDWAFGITLIEGFYWDWITDLCEEDSLSVHVVLEPVGHAPAAIPVSATLSALHPSRNTKSTWELFRPKIPEVAAGVTKMGAHAFPFLNHLSSGLKLASNVLESVTENEKNWFLYQFLDEKLKAPTVEWRINRKVLREYGPLLRGTLFLSFFGSSETTPGAVRLILRPQVRYYPKKGDLTFVIPTNKLDDEQVCIEVKPQDRKEPPVRSLPMS